MSILKNMARNLYHILDQKTGTPYHKKKTLQLWPHSKLRLKVENLSVHVEFSESIYNV